MLRTSPPQIRADALQDTGRGDQLEDEASQRYADTIGCDQTLYTAFCRRLAADSSAFASAGN